MERLLAVWVRELASEGDDGAFARCFVELLDELAVFCPFVDPVRFGLVTLPVRGPSRFFGGEPVVVDHVRAIVRRVTGYEAQIGIGEGLFTAFAAAQLAQSIEPGLSESFRRALPVSALDRRELATVCRRLGLHTVGSFADLAPARVAERFSRDALHVHRVARGEESELRGQRDTRLAARLNELRGVSATEEVQSGFFGDHRDVDHRAAVVANRVRARLGPQGVLTATVRGGRTPLDRATLRPWGAPEEAASHAQDPWPGRLPTPSPVTALAHPVAVRLLDEREHPVRVDPRGLLRASPVVVLFERGTTRAVQWYAGPWPTLERWWSTRRRRAYLQVLTSEEALLLYAERASWWLAGIYD